MTVLLRCMQMGERMKIRHLLMIGTQIYANALSAYIENMTDGTIIALV